MRVDRRKNSGITLIEVMVIIAIAIIIASIAIPVAIEVLSGEGRQHPAHLEE